jgi:hypothetical protein
VPKEASSGPDCVLRFAAVQYRFREEEARWGPIRPLLARLVLECLLEKQAAGAGSRAQLVAGLAAARWREMALATKIRVRVWVHTLRHKAVSLPGQAVRD